MNNLISVLIEREETLVGSIINRNYYFKVFPYLIFESTKVGGHWVYSIILRNFKSNL